MKKSKLKILSQIWNTKGVSIIEVLITVAIMLIVATGSIQFIPYMIQSQNTTHSIISEGSFREILGDMNRQACTETFAGLNIGDPFTTLKSDTGVILFDQSANDIFQRNFKIVKMESLPMTNLCINIKARVAGDCTSVGCTAPSGLPSPPSPPLTTPIPCLGTSSSSTQGYAQMQIAFSRHKSLYEKEDSTLACDSTDQSGCYKQTCLLRLIALPLPSGVTGTPVGDCEIINCGSSGSVSGSVGNCYKVETGGLTSIGCGTAQHISQQSVTAYGFDAGSGATGAGSTFIGYRTGKNTTSQYNTFIGYEAGKTNTTGVNNTFIGYKAGVNNTTESQNTFIGHEAGTDNTTGHSNTIVGEKAGKDNTTGNSNTFIGRWAGRLNTTGNNNIFIGRSAGNNNRSGNGNTFIGTYVGEMNTSNNNTFIGKQAGHHNTTGSKNTFIGNMAGHLNNTASDRLNISNIIYGKTSTTDDNTRYPSSGINVIGDIKATGTIHTTPSSKVYKKNIKPFKNHKQALKDIINTPLFTYEYKENYPNKKRMGIIAEELPESLKIKNEGPTLPDWPSIYGTFWASIKALYKKFNSSIEEIKKALSDFKKQFTEHNNKLMATKQKLNKAENLIKKTQRELESTKRNLADTNKKLETELRNTQEELKNLSTNEINDLKAKIQELTDEINTLKGE